MFLLDYFPPVAFIAITVGLFFLLGRDKNGS